MEKEEYNYSLVSLATDLYIILNNAMLEHNVPINLAVIPDLCNLLSDTKIARKGVYVGVCNDISLVCADENPHLNYDFDIKFYTKINRDNIIPFEEKHVKLIKYHSDCKKQYINDIFEMCRIANFIVD